jgi:cellulose synthase/poly-beta-1,6-N-acetylglucosamine synthase-like glycosyltransferase
MRNEEGNIVACLESVLAGDYAHDRLEILVIDGMSIDRSRAIVKDCARRHPLVKLLDNPKCIQAAALNIGIREANGDVLVRMDAHTLYAADYVRQCVELLETSEAVSVGGVQSTVGTDYTSSAIAVAVTTPFGIGDASFRYASRRTWVDTVYLGAWYRSTLEAAGGFNEEWVVNEDYELNYRLRKAGGRILVSPEIKSWYVVRPSLKALARRYFRYGFWKVKTLVAHPDSLRWRQLVPPLLVVALLTSVGMLSAGWRLAVVMPVLYLFACLAAAVRTASGRGWKYLPLLPIAFATIHISWGTGFLVGLVRWGRPRITLSSLAKAFGRTT